MKIGEVGANRPPFSFVQCMGGVFAAGFAILATVDLVRAETRRWIVRGDVTRECGLSGKASHGNHMVGVRGPNPSDFSPRLRVSA